MSLFDPIQGSSGSQPTLTTAGFNSNAPKILGNRTYTQENPAPQSSFGLNGGYYANKPTLIPGSMTAVYKYLGPATSNYSSLIYSAISPQAFTNAYNSQMGALNQARGYANQYSNPNEYWRAPTYNTNTSSPDLNSGFNATYGNATGAMQPALQNINDIIQKYAKDTPIFTDAEALNSGIMDAYSKAKNEYANLTPEASAAKYDAARAQFSPYQALGSNSANMLAKISGLSGAAEQNQAINELLNNQAVQSQLNLGQKAIANTAGAAGYLRSGRILQELTNYGQQLGSSAINQQQQNLLSQVGVGASAAGDVAGLYDKQVAAEKSLADARAGLQIGGQTALFNQRSTIENARLAQQTADRNAQLSAAGLSSQSSQALAKIYQDQAAGQTNNTQQQYQNALNEQHYNFEANSTASRATEQDKVRAAQDYLNYILNITMAEGRAGAEQAYGQGQTINTYDYLTNGPQTPPNYSVTPGTSPFGSNYNIVPNSPTVTA